jgi:hypothetical protein
MVTGRTGSAELPRIYRFVRTLVLLLSCVSTQALAQNPRETLHLTPELRIDGRQQSLVPIAGLAVSRKGTIAIIQRQDSRIVVYASDGRRVGAFGRSGEGPGEFRSLSDHVNWIGDTLYACSSDRITLISPSLKLVRTIRTAPSAQLPGDTAAPVHLLPQFTLLPGGRQLAVGLVLPRIPTPIPDAGRAFLLLNADGTVERSLLTTPPIQVPGYIGVYAQQSYSSVAPDGGMVADIYMPDLRQSTKTTAEYRVRAVDSSGSTIFSRGYSYQPVPLPTRTLDSATKTPALGSGHPMIAVHSVPPPAARPSGASHGPQQFHPTFFPPIRAILVGRDHSIWLDRSTADPKHHWEILDQHGNAVAEVDLSDNIRLMAADLTHIWVVELDQDNVPSVVRYRLSTP